MATDDEHHFEYALGFAVVRLWAALPREMQERVSDEATAGDASLREGLATFLHERHPRTAIEATGNMKLPTKKTLVACAYGCEGTTALAES